MANDKHKGGLGRGLASLIPTDAASGRPRLGDSAADIVLGLGRRDTTAHKPGAATTPTPGNPPRRTTSRVIPGAPQPVSPGTRGKAKPGPETTPTGETKTTTKDASSKVTPGIKTPRPKNTTGVNKPAATATSTKTPTATEFGASYREIPVELITPNPKQPRQVFDEEHLAELVHSITEFGLMQPIIVRRAPGDDDRYELIMGERRLRASKQAGLDTIPAIIRDTDDDAMLRDALLENIHRVQLNPLEEAAAYQQLLEEFGVTHAELASRIGRSRPVISNMIRLLDLPVVVQRRVAAGVLSAGHARALLGLNGGPHAQEQLAHKIISEGMSVRATEEAVTLANNAGAPRDTTAKPAQKKTPPEFAIHAADSLSEGLDTKVTVAVGKRNRGKIIVEFADKNDLDRILGILQPKK